MANSYQEAFPSEITNNDELVANRLRVFRADSDWRDDNEDFEEAGDLYEAKSGDSDDDGIPQVNLIRGAVEDYVAVAVKNAPKAHLQADRFIDPSTSEEEREMRMEALRESETTVNAYIRTILRDNNWVDVRRKALKQAGIFGVGYVKVNIDRSADARFSYRLRDLFSKPFRRWSSEDAKRYESLTERFSIEHVDSRDVFWQSGVRSCGKSMYRVSMVERFSTKTLRKRYENEDIAHGRPPHNVEEDTDGESGTTAVLTTWELEPFVREIVLGGSRGPSPKDAPPKDAPPKDAPPKDAPPKDALQEEGSAAESSAEEDSAEEDSEGKLSKEIASSLPGMTDWRMVKTVIAGGELIEREVWDSSQGAITLPVVPFYLRESETHPYGYSIPLMLQEQQSYVNYMQAAAMRQAKNSTSTQGTLIFQQNLGPGDEEEVDRVLEEGGVAKIQGNDISGVTDIREIAMPLNYNGSQINPAMIQAIQMGKENFQQQSQTVNEGAVSRARTGSAKRSEINLGDRPKTLSLEITSSATEDVYDALFELVRTHKTAEEMVRINRPGAEEGGTQAVLNQPYEREVPVYDAGGEPVMEGGEVKTRPMSLTMNDTSLDMHAVAEGRSNLPIDMVSKFQLLALLYEQKDPQTGEGLISHETLRELTLDDNIKAIDDRNREKSGDWQAQLQRIFEEHPEALQLVQQVLQQNLQGLGAPQQGAPQQGASGGDGATGGPPPPGFGGAGGGPQGAPQQGAPQQGAPQQGAPQQGAPQQGASGSGSSTPPDLQAERRERQREMRPAPDGSGPTFG